LDASFVDQLKKWSRMSDVASASIGHVLSSLEDESIDQSMPDARRVDSSSNEERKQKEAATSGSKTRERPERLRDLNRKSGVAASAFRLSMRLASFKP